MAEIDRAEYNRQIDQNKDTTNRAGSSFDLFNSKIPRRLFVKTLSVVPLVGLPFIVNGSSSEISITETPIEQMRRAVKEGKEFIRKAKSIPVIVTHEIGEGYPTAVPVGDSIADSDCTIETHQNQEFIRDVVDHVNGRFRAEGANSAEIIPDVFTNALPNGGLAYLLTEAGAASDKIMHNISTNLTKERRLSLYKPIYVVSAGGDDILNFFMDRATHDPLWFTTLETSAKNDIDSMISNFRKNIVQIKNYLKQATGTDGQKAQVVFTLLPEIIQLKAVKDNIRKATDEIQRIPGIYGNFKQNFTDVIAYANVELNNAIIEVALAKGETNPTNTCSFADTYTARIEKGDVCKVDNLHPSGASSNDADDGGYNDEAKIISGLFVVQH